MELTITTPFIDCRSLEVIINENNTVVKEYNDPCHGDYSEITSVDVYAVNINCMGWVYSVNKDLKDLIEEIIIDNYQDEVMI